LGRGDEVILLVGVIFLKIPQALKEFKFEMGGLRSVVH
jgi:hypothetical protein